MRLVHAELHRYGHVLKAPRRVPAVDQSFAARNTVVGFSPERSRRGAAVLNLTFLLVRAVVPQLLGSRHECHRRWVLRNPCMFRVPRGFLDCRWKALLKNGAEGAG